MPDTDINDLLAQYGMGGTGQEAPQTPPQSGAPQGFDYAFMLSQMNGGPQQEQTAPIQPPVQGGGANFSTGATSISPIGSPPDPSKNILPYEASAAKDLILPDDAEEQRRKILESIGLLNKKQDYIHDIPARVHDNLPLWLKKGGEAPTDPNVPENNPGKLAKVGSFLGELARFGSNPLAYALSTNPWDRARQMATQQAKLAEPAIANEINNQRGILTNLESTDAKRQIAQAREQRLIQALTAGTELKYDANQIKSYDENLKAWEAQGKISKVEAEKTRIDLGNQLLVGAVKAGSVKARDIQSIMDLMGNDAENIQNPQLKAMILASGLGIKAGMIPKTTTTNSQRNIDEMGINRGTATTRTTGPDLSSLLGTQKPTSAPPVNAGIGAGNTLPTQIPTKAPVASAPPGTQFQSAVPSKNPGMDMAAWQMLSGDRPQGMNAVMANNTRTRASKIASDLGMNMPEMIAAMHDAKANHTALDKLTSQYKILQPFGDMAEKNAQLLEKQMAGVSDILGPVLNTPLRSLQQKFGSERTAGMYAALEPVQKEFARILNGNSNVLSDKAKASMEAAISPGATVGQMRTALNIFRQDWAYRKESYEHGIETLKKASVFSNPQGTAPVNNSPTKRKPLEDIFK